MITIIRRDEARWCDVLAGAIRQLQGAPSPTAGELHENAMPISR